MNARALMRSAAVSIASIAILTILSELSPPVKEFLTLFGHHWIGKGVLGLVAFGVLYLAFKRSGKNSSLNDAWLVIGSVVISGLAIFGLYIWHFV